jgi:hypothetical protein
MRIKGQEQIAALIGVAPKTITEWQVLGFPVAVQGGPGVPSEYESAACIAWLVQRELSKVRSETPKDRLSRLQGDKIEQEMQRESGKLIPADEVEPMWESAVIAAREFMMGEPARIASLSIGLDKLAVESLLNTCFETYLVKLSNWRAAMLEDDEPDEAPGADSDDMGSAA